MKGFFVGANAGSAGLVYDGFSNNRTAQTLDSVPRTRGLTLQETQALAAPQSVSASGAVAFVKTQ